MADGTYANKNKSGNTAVMSSCTAGKMSPLVMVWRRANKPEREGVADSSSRSELCACWAKVVVMLLAIPRRHSVLMKLSVMKVFSTERNESKWATFTVVCEDAFQNVQILSTPNFTA